MLIKEGAAEAQGSVNVHNDTAGQQLNQDLQTALLIPACGFKLLRITESFCLYIFISFFPLFLLFLFFFFFPHSTISVWACGNPALQDLLPRLKMETEAWAAPGRFLVGQVPTWSHLPCLLIKALSLSISKMGE